MVTPVADDGPALATVTVYVKFTPTETGSGESARAIERSFCNRTSKGLLAPLWPLPSSARNTRLVAGCCTVMLPLQMPLVNGPAVAGVIGIVALAPVMYFRSTR